MREPRLFRLLLCVCLLAGLLGACAAQMRAGGEVVGGVAVGGRA